MKGEKIFNILETIGEVGMETVDFFIAMSLAGHGASGNRIEYIKNQIQDERLQRRFDREREYREKQKYYSMLYALKRDGLIEQRVNNGKKFLRLTVKGKDRVNILREKKADTLNRFKYNRESGSRLVIVIFDIPEDQKRKRNWLRAVLKNLGFTMVQKSVWLGRTKIPKDLLNDIRNLKMIDYIKIFEIVKAGNLENVLDPEDHPII